MTTTTPQQQPTDQRTFFRFFLSAEFLIPAALGASLLGAIAWGESAGGAQWRALQAAEAQSGAVNP